MITILMRPTVTSRNFWRAMQSSLQNIRQSCMIICVRSRRSMRRHIHPLLNLRFRRVLQPDMNFYVLNQGCFDSYDYQEILAYCQMRLNNGAAVVRFKFSSQEAFEQARADWINGDAIQEAARYYMTIYGMSQVEYHYGILENMKTIYYMF